MTITQVMINTGGEKILRNAYLRQQPGECDTAQQTLVKDTSKQCQFNVFGQYFSKYNVVKIRTTILPKFHKYISVLWG